MSVQFKYELTDAQANMAGNLAGQFKRDIDNCNNGSIETRKWYHKALEDRFAYVDSKINDKGESISQGKWVRL